MDKTYQKIFNAYECLNESIYGTENTTLSDINEIYVGFIINGKKWFSREAQDLFINKSKLVDPQELNQVKEKSDVMAREFIKWAYNNNYSGGIEGVWWTARPGSLKTIIGPTADESKDNPTDVLVKFSKGPADGFLGMSLKSTLKKSGDIGFSNPGVGTIEEDLGIDLSGIYAKNFEIFAKENNLPKMSATSRKDFLRNNPELREKSILIGEETLSQMRDVLLTKLNSLLKSSLDELKTHLFKTWLKVSNNPPYVKVTGRGNKAPYTATVTEIQNNPKMVALTFGKISFEPIGNETIGVKADEHRIFKMRFKFESEKMASSLKMSGDPW